MTSDNSPIQILSAPLGVLMKITFAVSAAGAAWAIFAKVPWQVDGLAAVTPPGGLSSVVAPEEGTLVYVRNEKGDIIADADGKETLKQINGFFNGIYEFNKSSEQYINNPTDEKIVEFEAKIDRMIQITTKTIFDEDELGKGGRAVFESTYPYLKENEIIAYIYNPARKVEVVNDATDARSKLEALRRTMKTYMIQKESYQNITGFLR